jgi:hypothetical protein
MRTFSNEMVLKNKNCYNKGGIKSFATLARDPLFASAIAEYCTKYFKDCPKEKLKIMEIGTGDGSFYSNFSEKFTYKVDYLGVDFSIKNVSNLRNLAHPVVGEMGHLPVKDNSQDLVFAFETLDDCPIEFLRKRNSEIEIKIVEGEKEEYVPLKDLGDHEKNILKILEEAEIEITQKEEIVPIGLIKTMLEINRTLSQDGLFIATDWFYGKKLLFKEPEFMISKGTFTSRVNIDVIENLCKRYSLCSELILLRDFLKETETGKIEGVLFEEDNLMRFINEDSLKKLPDYEKVISKCSIYKPKSYYDWFSDKDFYALIIKK